MALAVVTASGGLDSTTLAYLLAAEGWALQLVSVDYGQRHRRELEAAAGVAARLGAPHRTVRVEGLGLHGSALVDDAVAVPEGHYTDESMRATVVPNRNALLLDLATSVAVAEGAEAVGCAVHAGDHAVYPDCRPAFVEAYERLARVANEGFVPEGFRVLAPFLHRTKADIVTMASGLGVPVELTWSCYLGGSRHCGRCGTCVERREAFALAGVADPTEYSP